jgi:hypothetical protein
MGEVICDFGFWIEWARAAGFRQGRGENLAFDPKSKI